jgi:hypothetical protein
MHSPDATWETTLVIPETAKPIDVQTLDALLRIEELLTNILQTQQVLVDALPSRGIVAAAAELEDAKPTKGKRSNGK